MEDKENNANNNWIALIRRKIQRKFKRSRQKIGNSSNEESLQQQQQTHLSPAAINNENSTITSIQVHPLIAQNCEELKRELHKLAW